MFTVNCILYWKTKKWKKRPGIANFFLFTQLPFDKPKAYQEVVYSHNIEMKWSKEYDLGYHILHIYDKLVIKTLFRLFLSFQTNITIFTTNKCEKCPSSIRSWDSNPQPSEHESPPITTTQGLPHLLLGLLWLRNHTLYRNFFHQPKHNELSSSAQLNHCSNYYSYIIINKQLFSMMQVYVDGKVNFFLKNGPNPASFCLFLFFFSHCKEKYSTNLTINYKSIDGVLGSRTEAAGWKALSYGGTPIKLTSYCSTIYLDGRAIGTSKALQ